MNTSETSTNQFPRKGNRQRLRNFALSLAVIAHFAIASQAFAQRLASPRVQTNSRYQSNTQIKPASQTQVGSMQMMNNQSNGTGQLTLGSQHAGYYSLIDLNLQVEEGKSDVTPGFLYERYVDMPENFKFKWKNTRDNIVSVQWQVSTEKLDSGNPSMNQASILTTGLMSTVPAKNEARFFHIDFNSIMPATAPNNAIDYYIRVVTTDANSQERVPSKSVKLIYQRSNSSTRFTASGLGLTVKQQHAAMYAMSPMPVEIDMQTLYCGNDNESSGDEPYLVPFVVFADGQSIKVFGLGSSTVRVLSRNNLQGNVPDFDNNGDDVEDGSTINIPASTGIFTDTLTPIGFGELDDLEDANKTIGDAMAEHTKVYIVTIVMEEDATSAASIAAAKNKAEQVLIGKVNSLIQSMSIQGLLQGNVPDFENELMALQNSIEDDAVAAAIDAAMVPGWWTPAYQLILLPQIIDPDDFVGFDYTAISFGELLDAGPSGVPFELNMSSNNWEGAYRVNGRVKGLNFSR